jgi:hypothetical protein
MSDSKAEKNDEVSSSHSHRQSREEVTIFTISLTVLNALSYSACPTVATVTKFQVPSTCNYIDIMLIPGMWKR